MWSLFVLTFILSLTGINFEGSFKLSILTLMNTVNSSAYGIDDFDFQNLQNYLTRASYFDHICSFIPKNPKLFSDLGVS